MGTKGIIAEVCWPSQPSLLWTSQTANMSRETNEGVVIRCKAVTKILFPVVGPPPKPNRTYMEVPETILQSYIFIN